jgi:transketolase
MGGADFINVLFSEFLEYDPENPGWEARDRFFLDPGHMAPMLYGQLCLAGKFTLEDLQNLRQWGSVTPGHPEREIERMIENTSGPLGQGHTFAVGAAIAAKWFNQRYGEIHNPTIYAFISDGGVQEEISQGAGRLAGPRFGQPRYVLRLEHHSALDRLRRSDQRRCGSQICGMGMVCSGDSGQ